MITEHARHKLSQAMSKLDTLPAMPAIAQKLMSLELDTDEGEAQLLKLIEQDPQISAKLISLANSSAMGVTRKVCSVSDAALLLGLDRVKSVSMGIAVISNFPQLGGSVFFSPQELWLHSLTIAVAMHAISLTMPRQIRPKQDQLYLAGLLHDMGYMAIHYLDSEASNELHHQLRLQPKRAVMEIELQVLGTSHCYIGAQLAQKWNLPEEITHVLGHHHHAAGACSDNPLVCLLNLAEKLLPNFGITEYCGTEILVEEWEALGIDPDRESELRDTVNELAIQAAQIADNF